MEFREWAKAWRVLLLLASLNLLVLGGYAAHGLFILGARGIPAAGLTMVFIGGIVIFAVALVFAYLLRMGIAKNVVSGVLILLGGVVLLQDPVGPTLTASGIVGTSFVIIVTVTGTIGFYEGYVRSA